MEFFRVTVDRNYIPPTFSGWYGILDDKARRNKRAYDMPKHLMFRTEKHMQMVFTDVIEFPCFMVSREVRDTVLKYDPFMSFARIILYDGEKKRSREYHLPFPVCIQAEWEKSEKGSPIWLVDKEITKNKVIMEITVQERSYIIMRMDLVESILRRGVIGIGLEEVHMRSI